MKNQELISKRLIERGFKLFLIVSSSLFFNQLFAQGLEGIFVEEYYVSNAADAANTGFGAPPVGSTTYRVFVDLAPGFEVQQVSGYSNNILEISTTTSFFNSQVGASVGENIIPVTFGLGNTALDSYVAMGGGRSGLIAVPKTLDTDGSIIVNNTNTPPDDIPITTADGLLPGTPATTSTLGIDLAMFSATGGGDLIDDNGAYFNLNGAAGATPENMVLIGQFTTDGDFSFKLNLIIITEGSTEFYTHSEVIDFGGVLSTIHPDLIYPQIPGCTNEVACNYLSTATTDDGSCLVPEENCTQCNANNTALILIDADNDGICDAEEIAGCNISNACNFNPEATDNDGSCIVPVVNCSACNETNDGLVAIDDDGDGVCNAQDECPLLANLVNGDPCITEEGNEGTIANCACTEVIILGCLSQTACNYNPDANLSDGSCIEPVENCFVCNETNDGLEIVDTDGDGICDAEEIAGCTNQEACNYDEAATDDDGTCTDIPEENCTECSEDNTQLVLIDTDGDGICDAEEITGCTDPEAINYNPDATDDDGSCTYTAVISLLEFECGAFVMQVTNASQEPNNGGTATADTRTIYAYGPDNAAGVPTYTGSVWPYVVVPNGYETESTEITAAISTNENNVLLINGYPAYQYTGDGSEDDTNGTFGPWSYFMPDGLLSQDACATIGTDDVRAFGISIYPNPASNMLFIQNESENSISQISLIDQLGKTLILLRPSNENMDMNQFDVSGFANGVYILKIGLGDKIVQSKVILSR